MNLLTKLPFSLFLLSLMGCASKQDVDPRDPYENVNRKIYKFNQAVDATMFKPTAKIYKAILPPQARNGIRNVFNNFQMVPTVANDVLQGKFKVAYKDSWRLFINTTIGIGGLFDVAEKWGLPYQPNDLGITLGKWGDTDSPYFVMPIFGPSTFRDTIGTGFDYSVLSVYAQIEPPSAQYGLLGLSLLQFRSDFLDSETIVDEALDEYTLVRDAYLQNRNYKITGKKDDTAHADGALYIDGEDEALSSSDGSDNGALYVEELDDE